MEVLIKLGIFLLLAVVGFWRGRKNERAHLKQLAEEEAQVEHVTVFATRYPPHVSGAAMDPVLLTGSVVVGSDFYRMLLASLRKFVGGNYLSYENLMERGRRHALLRLKQDAAAKGVHMVFNVKYTTSRISNAARGAQHEAPQVEVLAYGTGFVPAAGSVAESAAHHVVGKPLTDLDGQTDLMKNQTSRWWLFTLFAALVVSVLKPALWPAPESAKPLPVDVVLLLTFGICIGWGWYAVRKKGLKKIEAILLALLGIPIFFVFLLIML